MPAIRWCSLLATLALALAITPYAGATTTVTTLNDSGHGSLRQAIADAPPGDTIDFAITGTIMLTSGELVITNDLAISGPGATNLTVSGNSASRVFSLTNVTATISGLTVANGRINGGGAGINCSGGSLLVSNCVVNSNVSSEQWAVGGAGICGRASSTLTVVDTIVSSNVAGGVGGGICASGGTLQVVNSAVVQNYSGDAGGGIYFDGGMLTITNSTVSGNSILANAGAGVRGDGSTNLIINSTICSNFIVGAYPNLYAGGGIYTDFTYSRAVTIIANTIVAGNQGANAPDCYGPISSADFNLIGNTNGCTITGVTTHNIYGKDPLLGPLADNGGPTLTHALSPGSPAIDHGSSGGLATDQRGQPRIFNFPTYFDAADGSDIGAYELQERAQTGPVFTVNSNDDVDDGVPGIAHCSLREAIHAANANPGTNTINFATAIPGLMSGVTGTIALTNGELMVTNSVNINGPGAANLTVSGNNESRVFSFNNVTSIVSGLTVSNGRITGRGAGINNTGGSLAINNCIVAGNTNEDNFSQYGGGLCNSTGAVSVVNSTFCGNRSGNGGGIANLGGQMIIVCTAISSNQAFVMGGWGGGGIYNVDGSGQQAFLALTNCTVSGNVTFNNPGYGGGIIGLGQSTTLLAHCTVVSNAAVVGGGLYSGTYQVFRAGNSIVAGNSAPGGGPDCAGTITSDDYNLIQNTTGAGLVGATTHNIYNQDPKLGPLADLGGPTPTHALRFDSRAIDAGNSDGLTTDQRSLPRPIGTPAVAGGDGSDIGAYEADPNLRVNGFGKTGADIWLSFNSMWGRIYRVESTDQLPPTWNVLTNDVPGTGGRFQTLDRGAASLPKRFYRTVLLP